MTMRLNRSQLLFWLTARTQKWAVLWSAATLTCMSGLAVSLATSGFGAPAFAQAGSSTPSPPQDAPIMRPGQRVRRPVGSVEIMTFGRTERDQVSFFKVEFLLRNETNKRLQFKVRDFVRLLADDVPRAPDETSPAWPSDLVVESESAEYAGATFSVRGRPRVVYLQFGSSNDGRTYLRWPE